jgi:hypothetical protein
VINIKSYILPVWSTKAIYCSAQPAATQQELLMILNFPPVRTPRQQ